MGVVVTSGKESGFVDKFVLDFVRFGLESKGIEHIVQDAPRAERVQITDMEKTYRGFSDISEYLSSLPGFVPNNANCDHTTEVMLDYGEDDLTKEDKEKMYGHLISCYDCRHDVSIKLRVIDNAPEINKLIRENRRREAENN